MAEAFSPQKSLLRNDMLRLAAIYIAHVPQSMVTLSKHMARDAGLFERLTASNEAGFTVDKYDETIQEFSDHWPEGLEWPRDIRRPPVKEARVQPILARRLKAESQQNQQ